MGAFFSAPGAAPFVALQAPVAAAERVSVREAEADACPGHHTMFSLRPCS